MKKHYLVLIKAYRTVVVEAEDEEDACEKCSEECTDFDWEIDEYTVDSELKTEREIESAVRHGAKKLEDW